jgi:hypothetical protein
MAVRNGFKDLGAIRPFFVEHIQHNHAAPKPIFMPTYSRERGEYQFDTWIQKGDWPQFLMFININTRKAYGYPMDTKAAKDVKIALQKFWNDTYTMSPPKRFLTDEDASYATPEIIRWYQEHHIDHTSTADNDHHRLGKINRLIRTIRDMHGPVQNIDADEMTSLLNEYNSSTHSQIGMSPNEMNADQEEKYINEMNKQTDEMLKLSYGFKKGDYVRLVIDKPVLGKRRNSLSTVSYKIIQQRGRQYVIQAHDLSVDTVPGFKLILCTDINKYPQAETIKNDKRAFVDELIRYNGMSKGSYLAKYEGDPTPHTVTIHMLREGNQTRLSLAERQYWAKICHLGTPQENLDLVPFQIRQMIPSKLSEK